MLQSQLSFLDNAIDEGLGRRIDLVTYSGRYLLLGVFYGKFICTYLVHHEQNDRLSGIVVLTLIACE